MAVREIVHAFLNADRPEDVYQFALDRVSPLVGATFACVYLIDEGSELMRLAAVHNWPDRYARFLGEMRVRLGHGPSGEAASERRSDRGARLDHRSRAGRLAGSRQPSSASARSSRCRSRRARRSSARSPSTSRRPTRRARETRHLMRMVADQMAATAEKARADRGSSAREYRAHGVERGARAAVRRGRGGEAREGRVPREHLPRAAHAAHRGDRLHFADAGRAWPARSPPNSRKRSSR